MIPHWNESFDTIVRICYYRSPDIDQRKSNAGDLGIVNVRISDVSDLDAGGHQMFAFDLKKV